MRGAQVKYYLPHSARINYNEYFSISDKIYGTNGFNLVLVLEKILEPNNAAFFHRSGKIKTITFRWPGM